MTWFDDQDVDTAARAIDPEAWNAVGSNDDSEELDFDRLNSLVLARAALSAVNPNRWRPIESAPKDGTIILAARFDGYRDERFGAKELWWQPEFDAWIAGARVMCVAAGYKFDDGSTERLHSPEIYKPSHWLPRPLPPEDGE